MEPKTQAIDPAWQVKPEPEKLDFVSPKRDFNRRDQSVQDIPPRTFADPDLHQRLRTWDNQNNARLQESLRDFTRGEGDEGTVFRSMVDVLVGDQIFDLARSSPRKTDPLKYPYTTTDVPKR